MFANQRFPKCFRQNEIRILHQADALLLHRLDCLNFGNGSFITPRSQSYSLVCLLS